MAHLSTINPDGSPQVTVIWIGLDGDDLVSTHMRDNVKLRNIRGGAWLHRSVLDHTSWRHRPMGDERPVMGPA